MAGRRRRARRIPTEPVVAKIDNLSHDGRGVAHIDGKTVFVFGGLPDETVEMVYKRTHKRFDETQVTKVLENPHPDRVEPQCSKFGICGGCNLQHLSSEAQRRYKLDMVLEQLQHMGTATPEHIETTLESPVWGYRYKARLGVKYVHKKERLLIGFREKYSPFIADMDDCPILNQQISEQIPTLSRLIESMDARQQIPQLEVAVGENHAAIVVRHLCPLSLADRQKFEAFAEESGIHLYGQAAGPDSLEPIYPKESTPLYYSLSDSLKLDFLPLDFTQVNPDINRQMVAQAMDWLAPQQDERILELFCGLGNFTLALAQLSNHITAVEGDASLIKRADLNAQSYGIEHISYAVADLQQTEILAHWLKAEYDCVLLDPPRSGAEEILAQLPLEGVKRVLYVSCNPATLARDSRILLGKGLKLERMGIMDMFPHTAHIETMALFSR